jgi:hypothetical protein
VIGSAPVESCVQLAPALGKRQTAMQLKQCGVAIVFLATSFMQMCRPQHLHAHTRLSTSTPPDSLAV